MNEMARDALNQRVKRLAYRLSYEAAAVEDLIGTLEELPATIHGYAIEVTLEDLQHLLYRYSKRLENGLKTDAEFSREIGEDVVVNE